MDTMKELRKRQEKAMENGGYKKIATIHKNTPQRIGWMLDQKWSHTHKMQWVDQHNGWTALWVKALETKKPSDAILDTWKDAPDAISNALKHFNHPFYAEADQYRQDVRKEQINKGAEKYPEPFNPHSWTARQLLRHAMQENVDQAHYIYGLYEQTDRISHELIDIISKLTFIAGKTTDYTSRAEILKVAKTANSIVKRVAGYDQDQQRCEEGAKSATRTDK